MAVCSSETLLSDAACLVCLPPQLLQVIKIKLLCQILAKQDPMATCDIQTILNEAALSGFLGKSMETLAVIEAQLLCNLNASFSAPVTGNQFHGNGDPNGVQVGSPPDLYIQDDADGRIWSKTSGVGTNTGWV